MPLQDEYPKACRNRTKQLRELLKVDAGLDAMQRETLATALNDMADKARDLDEIFERLLADPLLPHQVGELLIAFELTSAALRGWSSEIDGKLYEIGDRLTGAVEAQQPDM